VLNRSNCLLVLHKVQLIHRLLFLVHEKAIVCLVLWNKEKIQKIKTKKQGHNLIERISIEKIWFSSGRVTRMIRSNVRLGQC
jgi:hypothetical protein